MGERGDRIRKGPQAELGLVKMCIHSTPNNKNNLWYWYDKYRLWSTKVLRMIRTFGVDIIRSFCMHMIWYEICWRAYYDTQFSRSYDTHLPHNPNPTNRVAYIRQSQFFFVSTPRVNIFILCTIYTHFREIGLTSRDSNSGHLKRNNAIGQCAAHKATGTSENIL